MERVTSHFRVPRLRPWASSSKEGHLVRGCVLGAEQPDLGLESWRGMGQSLFPSLGEPSLQLTIWVLKCVKRWVGILGMCACHTPARVWRVPFKNAPWQGLDPPMFYAAITVAIQRPPAFLWLPCGRSSERSCSIVPRYGGLPV